MKLSNIITVVYLLISVILFSSFFENIFVWMSFFVNWLFLSVILLYHLKIERCYSPFLSAYVTFNFLFFIMAPMIQIGSLTAQIDVFPNYFPYSEKSVTFTNAIILIFHFIFFFSYLYFKKRYLKPISVSTYKHGYYTPLNIVILLLIGIVATVYSFDYLMNLINESHWRSAKLFDISVSKQLILMKVLYMVPFAGLVIAYHYLKQKRKISENTIIVFISLVMLFLLIVILKNPLTEKRNALGPIYITLLYLFVPKLLNSNVKSFLFLFFSIVIFFPLISGLTHLDATLDQILANPGLIIERYNKDGIIKVFTTLNYDAFANVTATIDYTVKNGFSYGYQLLSGLLFFIPRGIWASKPNSTGELIGDYLISDYDFFYSNLSNPMVAEGYVNFGIFGVIVMAFVLGYFVIKLLNWLRTNDPLKQIIAFYFAVHLLFFLRGDFANGFSYYIGTMIGVLFLPKIIDKFIRIALKKTKT